MFTEDYLSIIIENHWTDCKRCHHLPDVALVTSCLLTYGLNTALLKTLLHKDLKEENLDKYYELDLNADMMK